MATSAPFQLQDPYYNNDKVVNAFYDKYLGRAPDTAGKQFWSERLGNVGIERFAKEFATSAKTENPRAQPGSIYGVRQTQYGPEQFGLLPGEEGYRATAFSLIDTLRPFIVPIIAAVNPTMLLSIGSALGATSAAAAQALGTAALSGTSAALGGGSPEDILKAAAAGGLGSYAGSTAGEAVKAAQEAGTLSGTFGGNASLPAVASGAAGAGAGTLLQTGDIGQAALSALGAGTGQALGGAALDVLPENANVTVKSGLASALGGAGEAAVTGQDIAGSALASGLSGAAQDYYAAQKLNAAETAATPSANQLANIEDLIKQAYVDPSSKVEVAQAMATPAGGAALANAVEASIVRNMVTQLPASVLDKIVANSSPLQQVLSATERQAGSTLERIVSSAEGRAQLLKDVIANTPEFAKKYGNEATIKSLSDAGASTAARTIGGVAAALTPGNIFQETNEEAELAARRAADPNFNPAEVLPTVEVVASPEQWGADLTRTVVVPKTGGGIDPFGNISPQRDSIQSLYDRYLNREADQAGKEFWQERATQVSADQLQREFEEAARRELTSPQTQASTQTQTNTQTQTQPSTKTQTGTPKGTSGGGGGVGGTTGGVTPTITDTDREIINLTGIGGGSDQPTGPNQPSDTGGGEEGGEEDGAEDTGTEDTGITSTTTTPIRRKKKKRRGTVTTQIVPLTTLLGAAPTIMPGASALAQALSVGDAGGSYLDKKGQRRQPVWNVESLKLSDELGGSGYD